MKAEESKTGVYVLIDKLDADLHRCAKQAAWERRMLLKDWIVAAVAAYVRQHERRKARAQAHVKAGA
jgi:hypothetical protein